VLTLRAAEDEVVNVLQRFLVSPIITSTSCFYELVLVCVLAGRLKKSWTIFDIFWTDGMRD